MMGKKAFVTGGTGSIGAAIVREFRESGIEVGFQFNSNHEGAAKLAEETGAKAVRMNLADAFHIDLGDVDILVNSAGILLTKTSIEEVSDEEMDETLAVNLMAPFRLMRAVIPGMKARGWGRIINIGSIYAHRGVGKNSSYNISKHALLGMTRSAAKDLAADGITVNQVDPSAVDSRIIDDLARRFAASGGITEAEYKEQIAGVIPVGRLAAPRDIAAAVLYLSGEQSGFVTGESLIVDGGLIS
ncbi:SDR family NAD(P)-dependent oxidoreductase [Streptomyces griseoincarnatus]